MPEEFITANSEIEQKKTHHQQRPLRIAYMMSRFPKITETFILFEMIEQEKLGNRVHLYPLLREKQSVSHKEVEKFLARAHFEPFFSFPILKANLHYLRKSPLRYFRTIFEMLRGTLGSMNFFVGALGVLPKAVKFARDMEREKVEHIHAHFCTHPAFAAMTIHRLTGIPFSFTAHGSDLHVERRMLAEKIEAAAFAVTISKFNKAVMLDEGRQKYADKVHVVRCGIDPQIFIPKEASADSDIFKIICVGSFEEVKGHRFLVEACRILRDKGVRFRCDLIGDGPLRENIENLIKTARLEELVIVHGPQPREIVVQKLREADVKILPSVPTAGGKREGVPVVLMEAMAVGLPVISSRLSGIPELVEDGETGLLAEPRDSAGLAAALEKLATQPDLRKEMGVRGREKVLRDFSLAKNTRMLANLTRSCSPDSVLKNDGRTISRQNN